MLTERDEPTIDPATIRPAGMCEGLGHVLVYGNQAFVDQFGVESVGLPAREALIDLPPEAFALMDTVLRRRRPLARWIRLGSEDWRMTVAPRLDPGSGDVYGVSFHLRARSDQAIGAAPK